MFSFTPLQGALSESTASQSLLEFDGGVKILVDVGWDESFNVELLKELEKHVPTLSLILLTHATVPHIAAYAHCCKHIPLFTRIPVYATQPVINLGRTLTQELYSGTPLAATTIPQTSLNEVSYAYPQASLAGSTLLLQPPTPEEIGKYFSLIQALKYSQPHQPIPSPFSPPLNGLTITAYNSGHSLGGTIWQIQHGLESIVYAVDWNQARENVFSGAAWVGSRGGSGGTEVIEQLRKPTALICSSRTPELPLARAKRDEQLLESIKLCISRGGTVLIPTDSSARILELAYLLDHAWSDEAEKGNEIFKRTKLYLCGRTVHSTIKYAESSLEWMDESMVREFEAVASNMRRNGEPDGTKKGPFAFKHIKSLERKAQIDHILKEAAEDTEPRGRVILASDSSLEWGFSKEVLQSIASDARNLVILTEKPSFGATGRPSIARTLWQWWKERRDGVATEQTSSGDTFEQVYSGGRELAITINKRHALEGNELTVYQQWLATQRQLHAAVQSGAGAELEASADVVDDASSESSSESEGSVTQQQGKALNVSTTLAQVNRKKVILKDEDLGITILLKKKGVYDFDVRGKKGRERMFPIAIRRKRNDEFGEVIRPEEYLRAEEREEADGQDGDQVGSNKFEQGLGKKRKWEDVAAAGGKGGSGPNKRSQTNRNPSEPTDALANGAAAAENDVLDNLEDEVVEDILGPAKLVVSEETVTVRMRIAAVDFSGLHDKRSLNMLIPLIQPRKLILVAGSQDETLELAEECKKLLSAKLEQGIDVFTPAVGTTVDASVDTNAWVVKLADPLVKRLKWQNLRGMGIVTVTGVLYPGGGVVLDEAKEEGGGDEEAANKRLKIEDAPPPAQSTAITVLGSNSNTPATIPTLDVMPNNLVSSVRSAAQPLHVGDLRLADLRKAMQSSGHKAEFRGEGILVIDDVVKVRKSGNGRVELESVALPVETNVAGALSTMGGIMPSSAGGTFYAVKRKIYEGLAVVAGA
ncbi:cleavage factor two protein 2 [Rhypophila decipiens]|uniref:Cleavage and polyadenylation specificity factor subunit 2 n=1 Tax=Rhypophila decipiens TaxID=261697 RepID=A0AAN7BA69_9PEZI|nr:cleavage factor two protein 2 [Rhypophila decipiens]